MAGLYPPVAIAGTTKLAALKNATTSAVMRNQGSAMTRSISTPSTSNSGAQRCSRPPNRGAGRSQRARYRDARQRDARTARFERAIERRPDAFGRLQAAAALACRFTATARGDAWLLWCATSLPAAV